RPPLAPDLPYLVKVLIGSIYMLIGIYTLLRQRGRDSFLFCLWCLVSALLYLISPVPPADAEYRLLFAANQLARCLLPALTLHLPAPPGAADAAAGADAGHGRATATPPRRRRAWVPFLYLPAAALTALHLDLMLTNGRFLTGRPTAALLGTLDRVDLLHLVGF